MPTGPARPGDWILVTHSGGQGRSALAAVRALDLAGYRVAVGTSEPRSLPAGSRSCRRTVTLPQAVDPGYRDEVTDLVRRDGYRAVVATSDTVLLGLDLPGAHLVDKAALGRRCQEAGLATPASEIVGDAAGVRAAGEQFGFPIVVKPQVSVAPARRHDSPATLEDLGEGPFVVQPFLAGPLEAVSGVIRDGRLAAVVHQRALRTWPVECGTSCAAVTVERDRAREAAVARLLADHDGVFQVQFLGGCLIDVNPRVYGSLPLAVAAGVNLAAIALDPAPPTDPLAAEPGVRYRWIEADLRHVVDRLRRRAMTPREAVRALTPRRGTAHSIASRRDPVVQLRRLTTPLVR